MRPIVLISAALLSLSSPALADVAQLGDDGFVVRHAAEVGVTPAEAWDALVAPSKWWDARHTFSGDSANLWLDAQATGCFCEKLPLAKDAPDGARMGSVQHMRVVLAQPGRALRLQGGLGPLQSEAVTATLTITLKPLPGGTRILWEYVVGGFMRYKPGEIAPAVDGVLGGQMAGLAKLLGPIKAGPEAESAEQDEAGEGSDAPAESADRIESEPVAE